MQTKIGNSGITEEKYFIKSIGILCEKLCEIMENVNTCYSFQVINRLLSSLFVPKDHLLSNMMFVFSTFVESKIMVDMAFIFTYFLATSHVIYRASISENGFTLQRVLYRSMWWTFYLTLTISIIYQASSITIEVNVAFSVSFKY